MKVCSKCKLELNDSEFSPSSGGKYLRPECKSCAKKLSKQREKLKKEYGYPEPGYMCPICLKNEDELKGSGGNASVWVVDHNHNTNFFRGFLCHNCNRGLGVFEDNVERLNRAIKYINKNQVSIEDLAKILYNGGEDAYTKLKKINKLIKQ
jgi:hypothetical protein